MQHFQLFAFVDLYYVIDHKAVETQMLHLQEHHLMPAENSEFQWLLSHIPR